mgnify:FL=1
MSDPKQPKRRPRILAIDDTPANLMVLATALSGELSFQLATSGAAGLAMAEQARPDLVLLDVMMPEMDGLETCRRFRANPALCDVPIVFITALSEPGSEVEGLALGAADYLHKPIQVDIARQRIRNLLEREWWRQEVQLHREHLEELVRQRTAALEQTNAELTAARDAAEVANRVKANFLANMSHELLTPLNIITGMNGILSSRLNDQKLVTMTRKIDEAGRHLVNIIKDILYLAQLEDGQVQPIETFEVRALVRELEAEFQHAAAAKGLVLSETIDQTVPRLVLGQPSRIKEVLRHLLGNAIKFSERGRVEVVVQTLPKGHDHPDHLCFSVRDEGVGIPPGTDLFQAFVQQDDSSTRRHGGLGVGLAISKHLAQMMGGEIGFDSTLGQGSRFWVTMPYAPVEEAVSVWAETGPQPLPGDDTHERPCELQPEQMLALREFLQRLEQSDFDAVDSWEAMSGWLAQGTALNMAAMAHAMNHYEFDQAAVLIRQVLTQCEQIGER